MRYAQIRDRLIALFLFGVLAMSPPLLGIFRADAIVFGIPLLFLYLFAAWLVLVGLLALIVERASRAAPELPPES